MNHNLIIKYCNKLILIFADYPYIENFLYALYANLIAKQCESERKIQVQKLSLASYCLSEFAYAMGEEYTVITWQPEKYKPSKM